MENKVLKRQKIVYANPNPLFEKWLTEWKQEAAEKGWKTKYIYGKALQSLKKYPLPLKSGKEAKILENFGDKICQMLDDKLKEYNENKDSNASLTLHNLKGSTSMIGICSKKTSNISKTKKQILIEDHEKSNQNENDKASYSGTNAILLTLLKYEEEYQRTHVSKMELIKAAQSLCRSSFTVPKPGTYYTAWNAMGQLIKKEFVTKSGNPAWFSLTASGRQKGAKLKEAEQKSPKKIDALSINLPQNKKKSLFSISDSENSDEDIKGFEIKVSSSLNEKIALTSSAQQKSVKVKEVGCNNSKRITASYTKLLQNKMILPHSLSESEDSNEDIKMLEIRDSMLNEKCTSAYSHQEKSVKVKEAEYKSPEKINASPAKLLHNKRKLAHSMSESEDSDEDIKVLEIRDSSVNKNRFVTTGCSTSPNICTLSVPPGSLPQKECTEENKMMEIDPNYLPDLDDKYISNEYKLQLPKSPEPKNSSTQYSLNKNPDNFNIFVQPVNILLKESSKAIKNIEMDSNYLPDLDEPLSVRTAASKSSKYSSSDLCNQGSVPSVSTDFSPQKSNSYPSSQESCKSSSSSNFSIDQFNLAPGNFEIVLCVDTCEATGGSLGSKASKLAILLELQRNGINYNVRKLNVGDFVWIAKEIDKSFKDQSSGKELVLDFVVERKRMDDLAHSIKDGRFHEQKFRLKNCGLNRPIYLVEDHGCVQNFNLPASTLEQAIINTQVIDGFTVKRTKDSKETVAYLTLLTHYLKRHYEPKILTSCTYTSSQETEPCTTTFMTYKEFYSISAKNKKLSIKEMFAKQLLQLSGLSIDKAAAIIEKFPCPSKLMLAYSNCKSKEECEKLLANIKCKRSQRNLGPSVSKLIAQLYTTQGILP